MMIRLIITSWLLLCLSESVTAQEKKIIVEVRKNIELLSTLNNQISATFLKDSLADSYLYKTTRLMRLNYEHFQSFKEHPAVTATQQLADKIGTGVYLLGLYYEEFPQLKQKQPISELILQAIHPNKDSANYLVNAYFKQVVQFYHDTHFEQYFLSNQPLYQLAVNEVKQNLPSSRFIPTMEAYYGMKKNSYYIVVMPSFKSGWGMAWELDDKGKKDAFNIVAPLQEQVLGKDKQVLEAGFNNSHEIRNLSVHEFGHSFVNQLTMRSPFAAQINGYKHLFKPVPNQGQYSDWETIFNEHVVRAAEVRIALELGQAKESKRLQEAYKDWIYLTHFIEQLTYYEHNRRTYKCFEEYLPTLINSLKKLK
ncbi:DUF4932 domain-containing protein [Rhodocytophaga rosea]|uniref:DUF4932 domain-containing protein n=1 Tax=Rhodocytophaga rosea TaxID=2704465 RepID=A0A6C0GTR7_9BACT|nr:DUF4932 domain-containing protein [Rhodocytophaga rosea]QHT71561.1 DUF4932 domain-containing protein [Rhodocytophaga rosea]